MVASVQNPADLVNIALARIGSKHSVGDLYDGSMESNILLNVYAQTRDELLRMHDWGFAERDATLVLLKQQPLNAYIPPVYWSNIYPPIPWEFQYDYPADCLKIRSIKPVPMFIPDFDPQPYIFKIANDRTYTPTKKVILCHVENAVMVYTAQVTDPLVWEASFVEAFAASLARRIAPALIGLDAAKAEGQDEGVETAIAIIKQG